MCLVRQHFMITPATGTISAKGFRELNCELKSLATSEEEAEEDVEAVSQSETYTANVEIMTNVESVGMLSVDCMGTLIDVSLSPQQPPEMPV